MSNSVFAKQIGGMNIDDNSTYNNNDVVELSEKVLGIIQVVGIIVSVATLMILGIKYMMGSVDEKAEYKKTMVPYVIGAVLLFGATTIANAVYEFASGF